MTLKAQAKDPRRLQSHNPRPRLMEKFNKKEVEFNTILFSFLFFFFFFLATSVLVFIICDQVFLLYSIYPTSGLLLMKVMHIFFLPVIHTLVLI